MSLKSHHLPLHKKPLTLLSPVPSCTDSLMSNWNSDSSLMLEPNYVLVEGIDYDLPPGTHGDWSRRGLLSSSTMTLIQHLNSSHSHLVIHTILGQRELHVSLCVWN